MTFFQIEAFITLSTTLNYTKASNLIHTTQPNLSKLIVGMEQELGLLRRCAGRSGRARFGRGLCKRHCREGEEERKAGVPIRAESHFQYFHQRPTRST